LCDLEISESFFKSCSKWNNPKPGLVDKQTSSPANTGPVPIPVRLVAGFVAGLKNHQTKNIEIYISSRFKKYFTPHECVIYMNTKSIPAKPHLKQKLGPRSMSILAVKKKSWISRNHDFLKLTGRKKTIRKKIMKTL